MKKLFVMALAAIFAANISAQEAKVEKADCKKSFEDRTEMEIKILSDELYLDSLQAKKFAKTYREFKKAQFELRKDFKKKFAKDLNDRQVEKVLHFRGGHPCKGDCRHKGAPQRKHEHKK